MSYNWDDINIGRLDLDHSENFFKIRHSKHEKVVENVCKTKNKENSEKNELQNGKVHVKKIVKFNKNGKNILKESKQKEISCISQENKISSSTGPKFPEKTALKQKNNLVKSLVTKIPPKKNVISTVPTVFQYMEIYGKKKQEMLIQMRKNEKIQREFHSRPAPKFCANCPKIKKQNEKLIKKLTIPMTPRVVKIAKENEERKRKRIEEQLKKNATLKIPLNSQKCQPKKLETSKAPKPFNLQAEKRLEERKKYDSRCKKMMEEKKKREDEEKKRIAEIEWRKARNNTNFRAKPNPFK